MNDDFAAERFNVPKSEALDWLAHAGLTCGVHWWVSGNESRAPASPRTDAGRKAAETLAPTLAILNAALLKSRLVSCSNICQVPRGRDQRLASLRASLAAEFAKVDVVFVDPDTGISDRCLPNYVNRDEVAEIAKCHHTLIYQHCGHESAHKTVDRVFKQLGPDSSVGLKGVECWTRSPTPCVLVWVPRQSGKSASRSVTRWFKPQLPWEHLNTG